MTECIPSHYCVKYRMKQLYYKQRELIQGRVVYGLKFYLLVLEAVRNKFFFSPETIQFQVCQFIWKRITAKPRRLSRSEALRALLNHLFY